MGWAVGYDTTWDRLDGLRSRVQAEDLFDAFDVGWLIEQVEQQQQRLSDMAEQVEALHADATAQRAKLAHDIVIYGELDRLRAFVYGLIQLDVDMNARAAASLSSIIRDARAAIGGHAAGHVTHRCPPAGENAMPCCGRTPFEVSRLDRMTGDPADVTCEAER